MNEPRRGDLYWIEARDLRPARDGVAHPWVVVSDDVFNESRVPTVLVCGLSSRLSRADEPGTVLLEPGEGALPRQSVLVATQICTVDKDRLGARIGRLSADRVEAALDALRFVQRLSRR